jgi:hypothetical protein
MLNNYYYIRELSKALGSELKGLELVLGCFYFFANGFSVVISPFGNS